LPWREDLPDRSERIGRVQDEVRAPGCLQRRDDRGRVSGDGRSKFARHLGLAFRPGDRVHLGAKCAGDRYCKVAEATDTQDHDALARFDAAVLQASVGREASTKKRRCFGEIEARR